MQFLSVKKKSIFNVIKNINHLRARLKNSIYMVTGLMTLWSAICKWLLILKRLMCASVQGWTNITSCGFGHWRVELHNVGWFLWATVGHSPQCRQYASSAGSWTAGRRCREITQAFNWRVLMAILTILFLIIRNNCVHHLSCICSIADDFAIADNPWAQVWQTLPMKAS